MLLTDAVLFAGVVVLLVGVSTPLLTLIGVLRTAWRRLRDEPSAIGFGVDRAVLVHPSRVAVLIAAHDEEVVLPATLRSAGRQVAPEQIFVASDGSSDATADVAREFGANVVELWPNRGKAGALVAAIDRFRLAERFEVVVLLDADTELAPDYLATGLPLFAEPDVVAVAGTAVSNPRPGPTTRFGGLLVCYRQRVYVVVQYLQKFGQAARDLNAVTIVPGFASMYRTRVLSSIDITAPGLSIEDFNMTFEVHAKRLGRIAFHPHAAIALTQDPDVLRDYVKQVERWNLGFWQTVLRHRFRLRAFWFSLTLFIAELLLSSLVLLLVLPAVCLSLAASLVAGLAPELAPLAAPAVQADLGALSGALPPLALVLGVVIPDYLLTVLAAVVARRWSYLAYGLVFPVLRVVDALLCLIALFKALFVTSSGTWSSPSRRPTVDPRVQASSVAR